MPGDGDGDGDLDSSGETDEKEGHLSGTVICWLMEKNNRKRAVDG